MSSKEQVHSHDKTTAKQQSPQPEVQKSEIVDRQVGPDTILQRVRLDPQALTSRDVMQLQRTFGNQAVRRLLSGSGQGQPAIQRHFPQEEEEELMMKPDIQQVGPEGGKVPPQVESAINRARGGGQPLESTVQAQMSETLGFDFSGVRVHADSEADVLNQQLSAKAFTTGRDIFFKRGTYNPASGSGRELIAHELSHVVQQGSGRMSGGGDMTVRSAGDAFEREADALARQVAVGKYEAGANTGIKYQGKQTEVEGNKLEPIVKENVLRARLDSACLIPREIRQLHGTIMQTPNRIHETTQRKEPGNGNSILTYKNEKIEKTLRKRNIQVQQDGDSMIDDGKIGNITKLISNIRGTTMIQRMATANISPTLTQTGGTCGLYSLGNAISALDSSISDKNTHEQPLMNRILAKAVEAGTFVGEFFDADNLAKVASGIKYNSVSYSGRVEEFKTQNEMEGLIDASGADAVLIAYSVKDIAFYQSGLTLAGVDPSKVDPELLGHWSLVEQKAGDTLTVLDPNIENTRQHYSVTEMHQWNVAAQKHPSFSFREFERQLKGSIAGLRGVFRNLISAIPGTKAKALRDFILKITEPKGVEVVPINLKGKIVRVSRG